MASRAMIPDAVWRECILADGSTHEIELLASGGSNVFGCLVTLSPFVASLLRVDYAKGMGIDGGWVFVDAHVLVLLHYGMERRMPGGGAESVAHPMQG